MADYMEGKRPVLEALKSGMPVEELFLADNLSRDPLVEDIRRKAKKFGVAVKTVPRKRLDEMSKLGERDSHQGVIAKIRPFEYVGVRDIASAGDAFAAENGGRALVILLDHVNDAGNLGAIARSAEVFGASGLVIPKARAASITAATYKSSAGAIAHLPVAQVSNLVQAIERLKKEGYWVAGASEHATEPIWKANLKGKMALVMGNEAEGISRIVAENCDFFVKLPQVGEIESLNVAQAATACMYEWLRQNQTA